MHEWWISTDVALKLEAVRDSITSEYVNGATITSVFTDSSGAAVATAISYSHISGTNGNYVATLPNTVSLTEGAQYTETITIVAGAYTTTIKRVGRASYKGPG